MPAGPSKQPLFAPLAEPAYRRLFAAQVVSLLGTGLGTVALALLAFELAPAEAGAVMGTALALKMVAYVGIAPVVGALAHRVPRKAALIALDVVRAALLLLLPFVSEVWQVYALIFLISAAAAGFTPLFQATLPDLLPDEARYLRALSLSRLAYELEALLSPTAAALLLLAIGFSDLFFLNAAAFVASAVLVSLAALPPPHPHERPGGLGHGLAFGVTAYLRTPQLRGLLLATTAAALGGAMVIVNTVVYVRGALGLSESLTAAAFIASGGGAMAVAVVLPRAIERLPLRRLVLAGAALTGATLAAGASLPGFGGLLGLWLMMGAAMSLVQTPAGRLIAGSCREADRPAFFSAHFALSHAGWLAGYLLAGWLGSAAGLGPTFLVAGLAALAAAGLAHRTWPRAADTGGPVLEHAHPAMVHTHPHVHDAHHRHDHEGWEGPEPHTHPHRHAPLRHRHAYVIDLHHPAWPG